MTTKTCLYKVFKPNKTMEQLVTTDNRSAEQQRREVSWWYFTWTHASLNGVCLFVGCCYFFKLRSHRSHHKSDTCLALELPFPSSYQIHISMMCGIQMIYHYHLWKPTNMLMMSTANVIIYIFHTVSIQIGFDKSNKGAHNGPVTEKNDDAHRTPLTQTHTHTFIHWNWER